MEKRVEELVEELQREGYTNIFLWEDKKGSYYPFHSHPYREIRVVIEGELIIEEENGARHHLKRGDRLEVTPGLRHKALAVEDCKYLCGSKG
jgi:quercetin dioxygenase-like cupin family protein